MRNFLFSAIFWTVLIGTCVFNFIIACVIWIVTTPFDPNRRINHLFSCAWATLYAKLFPGWHVQILHREKIKPHTPYVFVANHTSIADIVLCFCLFRQFKWVSKKEVFLIPFLGWNMRMCRYIPLKRGDKKSISHMMTSCRMWLRRGIPIMMFPEGTRSRDGTLLPFKTGAFALANECQVAVIPVVIHGGMSVIPKHGRLFSHPARLIVEVLEPMRSAPHESDEIFTDRVHALMSTHIAQQRHHHHAV